MPNPPLNLVIVRAACWLVMVLCLLAVLVLLDVWRIERRVGTAMSSVAMVILACVLVAIGGIFAKVAWNGNIAPHCVEVCP